MLRAASFTAHFLYAVSPRFISLSALSLIAFVVMDAANARSALSLPAGTLVAGRYRIGQRIGEGGMGVVLAARDLTEERDVAFKILQLAGDADHTERFLRESRLAAKIASEHVVRVFDSGSFDGHPFLVMERLEGEDFGAKIRGSGSALPLFAVADCVVQTCEALAHAHGAGIVHRDIKASNLFDHVRPDTSHVVKVLDFGIAKVFAASVADAGGAEIERTLTRTRDGGFLGSPPYMSPEHIRDPRNLDGRADLWSLGVVMYRLLSARFPFVGESTGEVLAAILERRPQRIRDLGIDLPDEVDAIIARCLSRAREERFADAGALALAMAPFASPEWRSYGERVAAIVTRAPASNRRAGTNAIFIDEPSTRTVPPPIDVPSTKDHASTTQLMISAPARSSVVPPAFVAPTAPSTAVAAPPAPTRSPPKALLALVALLVLAGVVAIVVTMKRRHQDDPAISPTTTAAATTTAVAAATEDVPSATATSTSPAATTAPSAIASSVAKGRRPAGTHALPRPAASPAASATTTASQKKRELQANPYDVAP